MQEVIIERKFSPEIKYGDRTLGDIITKTHPPTETSGAKGFLGKIRVNCT